jgi:hemerythrin-like metal-binding protein
MFQVEEERMAEITWSPALSVGVAQFDREHQRLIGYINDLRRAMSEGAGHRAVGTVLASLVNYTAAHFAHEESLLREHAYPGFVAHRKEHQALTAKVVALQRDFDAGQTSLALEIHDLLTKWLRHHILETDRAYESFLNGKGVA